MQYLAEYSKDFKNHKLKGLIGYSFEDQKDDYFTGYRQDFPSNDYTVMSMGGSTNQQTTGNVTEWAIQSVFGRLKYSFKEKYLLESTVRYDGSSRFPESKKYATFPSIAAGWRVSEEEFFKQTLPFVSSMKLKASWGILGNQNIGNYPYQTTLQSGTFYPIGDVLATGASYTTYKDPKIHWESTKTTDVGTELGFFNQKLTFNVTYFNRNTSDILYKPTSSVSSILGVSISETNTGEVRNSGWEFEIGHNNKIGDFSYSINGNLSIINNKVVTLGLGNVVQPNGMIGNGSDLFVGLPMQMYYGFLSDGLFLNQDEINTWANQKAVTPTAKPGDIRYKDISGPDGIPDGKVDATYDRTYLGSRIPKYTFSLNLNSSYRNFDISLLLQGVAGVKGMLTNYAGYAFYNQGTIQQWMIDEHFDPANPVRNSGYPRLEILTTSGSPNTVISDFWVLNASYLRIKSFQLGYTIPKRLSSLAGIDHVRLYCNAENLFSFNSYRKGWDPELSTTGDYYPILGTYTFGVNVTF